ncbi:MAG: hypothetical protein JWO35_396 [Candidatus Saccharibacteria bacterium]|nr:hypothetical protein [Candidatus Saccharibacteria bacterium]
MIKRQKSTNQQGFTIIELMIATSILSVILVMATIMMTSIGRLYYKGINQVRVQDNVRSISEGITQRLQLTNMAVADNTDPTQVKAYCVGKTRYTFVLGSKLGGIVQHVLWRDTLLSGTCRASDFTQPGDELITPNARLTAFSIAGDSPYIVNIGVAYGDDDLLTNPRGSSDGTRQDAADGTRVQCNGDIGQQFCATAYSVSVITKRL